MRRQSSFSAAPWHSPETSLAADAYERVELMNGLGIVFKYTGRFDEAETLYRQALVIAAAVHGEDHPDLATLYPTSAVSPTPEATSRRRSGMRAAPSRSAPVLRSGDLDLAADRAALAPILDALGKDAEAETLFREAISVFEQALGSDHYEVGVDPTSPHYSAKR